MKTSGPMVDLTLWINPTETHTFGDATVLVNMKIICQLQMLIQVKETQYEIAVVFHTFPQDVLFLLQTYSHHCGHTHLNQAVVCSSHTVHG